MAAAQAKVGKRAVKEEANYVAEWLNMKLCSDGLSADVALKVLGVIIQLAERGNGNIKQSLALACKVPVGDMSAFEGAPDPIFGARPQEMVRFSAAEAATVLQSALVAAAKMSAEASKAEALALDPTSSLSSLSQANTRPDFVATPKTKREEKKHQKMFKQMEKTEEKRMKYEKKQALIRASNAKIWATEILPHFAETRSSRRVDQLLWDGIPFQVRGQVWTTAIGNASNVKPTAYTGTTSPCNGGWRWN